MREIFGHTSGRIFLGVLLVSTVALIAVIGLGWLNTPAGETPRVLFGWVTLPLALGIGYVLIWLAAYLVYFFKFWPFR